MLDRFRSEDATTHGYGPANVISLLKELRGHLRGVDLSGLTIRGAYLQGIEMQDANLSGTHLQETVFTEAFDAIFSLAVSGNGQYWATGSNSGELRFWREEGRTLHLILQAYTAPVYALAFSPDGSMVSSGSWNGVIKLWDVASGVLLWTGEEHSSIIEGLAFAPDGLTLASCGADGIVRIWDCSSGACLQTLQGDEGPVFSVA